MTTKTDTITAVSNDTDFPSNTHRLAHYQRILKVAGEELNCETTAIIVNRYTGIDVTEELDALGFEVVIVTRDRSEET